MKYTTERRMVGLLKSGKFEFVAFNAQRYDKANLKVVKGCTGLILLLIDSYTNAKCETYKSLH